MLTSRFPLILGLILLGILTRLIPHPPNFTAMSAIAFFGASTLGGLGLSFAVVFIAMFFSDLFFGMHNSMLFVYLSFTIILLMGHWLKEKQTTFTIPLHLVIASLLFFTISNFGVWIAGNLYPKTWEGLITCYVAAIPFLKNQILGDLIYGCMMFGCFAWLKHNDDSLEGCTSSR